MNKIRLSIIFSLFIFLCSCGGTKNTDNKKDSLQDSVTVKITDTLSIAQHLGGDSIETKNGSDVLFRFNSSLAKHAKKLMTAKEVRKSLTPIACDENGISYTFKRYLYLDSLHAAKGTLHPDIGDLVDVKIYFLDSIRLAQNVKGICWSMDYQSYEACPYSSGTYYLLTTFDANGKQIATTLLAEKSSGADAPVAWSSDKSATLFTDYSFKEISRDSSWEDPD